MTKNINEKCIIAFQAEVKEKEALISQANEKHISVSDLIRHKLFYTTELKLDSNNYNFGM